MNTERTKRYSEWVNKLIRDVKQDARIALAEDLLNILTDTSLSDSEKVQQTLEIVESIVSED